ncbi:heme transporter CcmC [Rossellomorea marisflavi]|uniref:Heme response regulator HssR n=1 Tax=Rossellomorea marisflavi TaxID=189381 RepID=A0A0M0G5J8_9BACI|nr:response regulator transcription factor [Rossellomorea marisflavi]KON84706.1 heme transporter CcmC [Rossellomorea marisflavi]MDR4938066.1 response regulator transcription factor [Rossellomorea marisflavi]UTE71952.1 response regulator transcription factor [Rossellomorea marisflavi]
MKILVVDDDLHIQRLVSIHLTKEGYHVLKASDADEALHLLEEERVDLAIVDVMMPGMNGFDLTKILTEDLSIPVILLTAKGQLEDKEKGFLSGTEDYIVKPFEPKELLFRVQVILRRYERSMRDEIVMGNTSINRKTFEVVINQETLILPLKEFEILYTLMGRANKVTSRGLLIEEIWGLEEEGTELRLNTHMNRIRDRLKKHGSSVEIHTVRGVGYRLEGA